MSGCSSVRQVGPQAEESFGRESTVIVVLSSATFSHELNCSPTNPPDFPDGFAPAVQKRTRNLDRSRLFARHQNWGDARKFFELLLDNCAKSDDVSAEPSAHRARALAAGGPGGVAAVAGRLSGRTLANQVPDTVEGCQTAAPVRRPAPRSGRIAQDLDRCLSSRGNPCASSAFSRHRTRKRKFRRASPMLGKRKRPQIPKQGGLPISANLFAALR